MSRTAGSKNADHDEQRLALARSVRGLVLAPGGPGASLRQMAAAAAVSVATLRHYFGDREGVLRAVLESQWLDAAPYLARAAVPAAEDVRAGVLAMLRELREAWFVHGVGRVYAASLETGLSAPGLGPAFVNYLLEPLLQMAEAHLRRQIEFGRLRPCNERYAALALLSPVVLGLLHQDSLAGASCRPLDLDDFFASHVDAFLRGYPPT